MKKINSIISCCLGNFLEWYDFGLFVILSPLFSRLFFPSFDNRTAMIATATIFSIGFVCRPVGAIIFGYLGDRYGRALTLRLSILTIALPTLCIGVLPTYDKAGIASPLLLMVVRIIQGISVGGEYSGNLIYLIEMAPVRFRATTSTLASMSANLGVLFASVTGFLLTFFYSQSAFESIGWRIPYIVSGLVCILLCAFRLKIIETPIFDHLKKKQLIIENPIKIIFTKQIFLLLRILGLVAMGSTFYFFAFVFIPIFLAQYQSLSIQNVSILMSILILLMIILAPLAGILCDLLGRRTMLLFNSLFIMLIIIPGFYLLHFNYSTLTFVVLFFFTIASTLEQGTTPVALVEHFPASTRYTGLSLGYNIGNGLLGGTVPIIATWLSSNSLMGNVMPAIYVGMWAVVTYLVSYFFIYTSKSAIDLKK